MTTYDELLKSHREEQYRQQEKLLWLINNNNLLEFKKALEAIVVGDHVMEPVLKRAILEKSCDFVDAVLDCLQENCQIANVSLGDAQHIMCSNDISRFEKIIRHPYIDTDVVPLLAKAVEKNLVQEAKVLSSLFVECYKPNQEKILAGLFELSEEYKSEDTVLEIVKNFDVSMLSHSVLQKMVIFNRSKCIEYCLSKMSHETANDVLVNAAFVGNVELIGILLKRADPLFNNSSALLHAAKAGNVKAVAALMEVSDPTAGKSAALRAAALNNDVDIINLLLPVSSPHEAFWSLERYTEGPQKWPYFSEAYDIFCQKERYYQAIEESQSVEGPSKKRKI